MSAFWIIVIIVILVGWWFFNRSPKKESMVGNFSKKEGISEETVFEAQNRFEEKLQNVDFPDAISGREIYIFGNLMNGWYRELSGKNRYNNEMTQKIREDWLDYMEALGDRSTYNYLSLEAEDEAKSDGYREDHVMASRKAFAIEDAFAAAIGKEAIEKLKEIRDKDFFSFDKHGNLAPEGHEYDLSGKLKKKRKS